MPKIVTLLTDFGLLDPYVGVMKGTIVQRCADAHLVDLTHEIKRQQVGPASFWLKNAHGYFPESSVHLAVVDPGVGTSRRPLAVRTGGHFFVGPDNGIFSDLLDAADIKDVEAVALNRPSINPHGRVGTTFDGRDLFSPAAGLLAQGAPLEDLGDRVEPASLVRRASGPPSVRVIDHYGNLITDAPLPKAGESVSLLGRKIPWASTYSDAEPGALLALRGSWNTIEIASNRQSAEEILDARLGDLITVD